METIREIAGRRGVLRGVVHRPNGGGTRRAAVFLHGYFSSNCIGPSRLYVQISRILARYGYSAWRFDCFGIGNSDGEFKETSYESELADYRTVVHAAIEEAAPSEMLLVGHSMGTSLAVRLAYEQERVTKLLLLSPSLGRLSFPTALFSPENLRELQANGATIRKGLYVTRDYVEKFQAEDIFDLCGELRVSTTLVYGTADQFYSYKDVKQAAKAIRAKHMLLVPGGDHNFIEGDSRQRILKMLTDHIGQW